MTKSFRLEIPSGETRVLLHACCAPCSCAIVECLAAAGLRPVLFYSNPNIFPEREYSKRRDECLRFAAAYGLDFIEDPYDHGAWQRVTKGLEDAPEQGPRCTECFKLRLVRAARYASRNGFTLLATTLASSRWKDLAQVDAAGQYACSLFPGVSWWGANWRRGGLQERRSALIREYGFYNQTWCGCEFSRH